MSPAGPSQLVTLPNLLSLSRIPLGGVFWGVLARSPAHSVLPFAVLVAAAATDVLDGWVARRRHGSNPPGAGAWLDPICDKLFVGLVLAAIYVQRRPPLALVACIVARELVQLPMAVLYRASQTLRRWLRYDFRASVLGKAATVSQFGAVAALILNEPAAWPLALSALALGILALADYIRRAVLISRRRQQAEERKQ